MKTDYRILIVDDETSNIQLMRQILKDKYSLSIATDGEKALQLSHSVKPDLILLDVMMPNMDGYEVCKRLKSDKRTANIPVIFVTAKVEIEDEQTGFDVGGVDYIAKPVSKPIVLARIKTHLKLYDQNRTYRNMVKEQTSELQSSQRAAIHMLGEAGHYNDTDTAVHIWRMASFASAIARKAGWSVEKAAIIEMAAPMHDTGKIGIDDSILKKPGKLNDEEWKTMKNHSTIGHAILSKSNSHLFEMAADIALYHHEKWDGSGYPSGLKEEDIPESARIVAIADVFDALTMKRPYKKAWTIKKSFDEIEKFKGIHFDPFLVDCFLEIKSEIIELKNFWDSQGEVQSDIYNFG